jgi:hypothetical protein
MCNVASTNAQRAARSASGPSAPPLEKAVPSAEHGTLRRPWSAPCACRFSASPAVGGAAEPPARSKSRWGHYSATIRPSRERLTRD